VADLRRGGLVGKTGQRKSSRLRTAQGTSKPPDAAGKDKESHRQPLRKADAPEPVVLGEALARFPVTGFGFRHNQLVRLVCAPVYEPRGFSDVKIREIVMAWWRHWHDRGVCRTPPDARTIDQEIRRTRRSHSRGRITTRVASRYASLIALLRRPLPFLLYGGLGAGRPRNPGRCGGVPPRPTLWSLC
jgi:hypothetical protein